MTRLVLAILLALAVAPSIAGCGKKGDPRLPDGVSDEYPRKYPRQ